LHGRLAQTESLRHLTSGPFLHAPEDPHRALLPIKIVQRVRQRVPQLAPGREPLGVFDTIRSAAKFQPEGVLLPGQLPTTNPRRTSGKQPQQRTPARDTFRWNARVGEGLLDPVPPLMQPQPKGRSNVLGVSGRDAKAPQPGNR